MQIILGDMRTVLAGIAENSIDGCVTDPPYHLTEITARYSATTVDNQADSNSRRAKNPESHDAMARLSKGFMGKAWDGGDIAFKPETWREVFRVLKPGAHLFAFGGTRRYHRMVCAIEDAGFEIRNQVQWLYGTGFPKSHEQLNGWGTGLKPGFEPIVMARKPLIGTVAENLAMFSVGALNIEACRSQNGRWPANIVHDGSDEVIDAFPDGTGATGQVSGKEPSNATGIVYNPRQRVASGPPMDRPGNASRFFYSAKADKEDRAGSGHPTIKPVALMQWLARMVTPAGGWILDPFAGSGTTMEACRREGFECIAIEKEREYFLDILVRMRCIAPRHHDWFGPIQDWDMPEEKEPVRTVDPNARLASIDFDGVTYRTGQRIIMFDAWMKNPQRMKIVWLTNTPGVVAECEARGMRNFSPLGRRVVIPDLFSPLMPWEYE